MTDESQWMGRKAAVEEMAKKAGVALDTLVRRA